MERYIALLCGVNVGGKNTIPMAILKSTLEAQGFLDVFTYINSGNVIFTAGETDRTVLQQRCRQAIQDQFQLDIPVAILSAAQLSDALRHAPEWWDDGSKSKHIAIFMIAPATADALIHEVGINQAYEKVSAHGPVIFWSAPLKTYSRTRWSNIIATPAYDCITIRNASTAKRLHELSRPQSSSAGNGLDITGSK